MWGERIDIQSGDLPSVRYPHAMDGSGERDETVILQYNNGERPTTRVWQVIT
jgi:hypothetical protein